jgi:hypothetical protein
MLGELYLLQTAVLQIVTIPEITEAVSTVVPETWQAIMEVSQEIMERVG